MRRTAWTLPRSADRELDTAVERVVTWARVRRRRPADRLDLRAQLAAIERALLVTALARTGANQTRAAAMLKLSRRTLIVKLERHGIKPAPVPERRGRRASD
jgi:DNA-binding protein Fis